MFNLVHSVIFLPLFNLYVFLVSLMPAHNIALAIILLTLLVRLVLVPLRHKGVHSQMKLRDIQGDMKEIQTKHKEDKQAQSAALMQLYKDKGVNPLSGCLPQLVQLPLLYALYYVFRQPIGPQHFDLLYSFTPHVVDASTRFFWLPDIAKADFTFVLPVLTGVAQFFYARTLQQSMPVSSDPKDVTTMMNKQMMYMLPAFIVLIGRTLPAALSLYWIVGMIADWSQQAYSMNHYRKTVGNAKVAVSVRSRKEKK